MKKLFVTALLGLAAVSGWAQGTINFNNGGVSFKSVADRFVYLGSVGGNNTKLVGVNYVAGLFYMVGGSQAISSPTAGIQAGAVAPFRALTTASPGLWLNPLSVGANRVLDGVTPSGVGSPGIHVATLQVRVWDSVRFASFAAAFQAGQYGWSQAWNYTVPEPGSLPSEYYLNDLQAFAVVPEPSTIALGVLGVAGLFLLRRRNK